MYRVLIEANELYPHLEDSKWRVVDCRFELRAPEAGRDAWLGEHIPRAAYADLERDLSDMSRTGRGRHPLPGGAALCRTFGRLGIGQDTQVVAYDSADGSIAARLWWLLRYMGHEAVAVLDGGWQAWCAADYPRSSGEEHPPAAVFRGSPREDRVVASEDVLRAPCVVDARDPRRYRGEAEPLDPVAGHIPGAINAPFRDNVAADGRFLSAARLRERFASLLGDCPSSDAVFYCGSGVTACHNLLALARAGMTEGRLYAGSWSEWCSERSRPVARG